MSLRFHKGAVPSKLKIEIAPATKVIRSDKGLLLPVQIALIIFMLKIVRDFARGDGIFVDLKPRTGIILQILGVIYFLSMVGRYVVTMVLHPELRWFTGTIPIWFHFVLAAFVFTLGHYQVRRNSAQGPAP